MNTFDNARSRRAFLRSGLTLGSAMVLGSCASQVIGDKTAMTGPAINPRMPKAPVPPAPQTASAIAKAPTAPRGVRPELFQRALAALDSHGDRIAKRDVIALADFTPFSAKPRLQVINLEDGTMHEMLVAHGSGSDPSHSGYLHSFSNVPNSNSTSEGAFLTSNFYVGKHGKSQRLDGLDPTNNNARARAIVIHGAWYANADMIEKHGMLGRSQGCFAVGEPHRDKVFAMLGEGRLLFAGKV
ncbi:murein L,D-transpeptidase catalytic domain family protein [Stakelama sp. CBK3Z-3]|uniref:Murein L,D-transpeptidase catalytic domain family protein n=1 Tax=Stakelama flava TaxID=2860338 RepID=A0ABS6XJM8_9SPHN|nr:murein L,D-transpeptidase catalytic domain family protein [Stakelama flava]MBW4330408.1 murein L,D-transpeptidase catalytic domain family protein [Stakelama flava]